MPPVATDQLGSELYGLVEELYPICRSITGDGVRETLEILRRYVPLDTHEVPTGTPVLDWTIPNEWNIRDAWIKDRSGERVVDFQKSNLHVLNYSTPLHRWMPTSELRQHLVSMPDRPDWIPYRTSYYKEAWGFCVSHRQLESMQDAEYEVCIDSTLSEGSLTYGEFVVPGHTEDEVLLSCHVCHPSLCNDNLAGISVVVHLARALLAGDTPRYTYRFLFIPGTIGSITWLSRNRERVQHIAHGLVITCVGDAGGFAYKKSRRGDAMIDRAAAHVLKHCGSPFSIGEFFPYGYDERQFCSPGFNLPVGCFMRSPHGTFPEYHTSADDLDFVTPQSMAESFARLVEIIDVLEGDAVYVNTSPYGEPQLGKRGLYEAIGGDPDAAHRQLGMLWVLNLSDGTHTLLDIAERAALPFAEVASMAHLLAQHGLLTRTRSVEKGE
jgi:aminopeptidase-like protein